MVAMRCRHLSVRHAAQLATGCHSEQRLMHGLEQILLRNLNLRPFHRQLLMKHLQVFNRLGRGRLRQRGDPERRKLHQYRSICRSRHADDNELQGR